MRISDVRDGEPFKGARQPAHGDGHLMNVEGIRIKATTAGAQRRQRRHRARSRTYQRKKPPTRQGRGRKVRPEGCQGHSGRELVERLYSLHRRKGSIGRRNDRTTGEETQYY